MEKKYIDLELEKKYAQVVRFFAKTQGTVIDLQSMIFLIGVRELGQVRKFKKQEKIDLMHLAVCRLLTPYGYYELEGLDDAGWAHYKQIEELPPLDQSEQERLMKDAMVYYFEQERLLE
jgi:hypothetical protein